VPSLFGKPQSYASFLGQEDYYFFKDELLVVMPNGYGLYKHTGLPAADMAAIKALPAPGTTKGDPLIAADFNFLLGHEQDPMRWQSGPLEAAAEGR